jgi:hypothetical protein
MPGSSIQSNAFAFDAVQVLRRGGMTCPQAVYIAARARWLKGIKVIYGRQFGGGGWGGPFHVGLWHCYVLNRGSDFLNGRCWRGARYVRFSDHQSDWRFPDRGFFPPTLNPNVQPVSNFRSGYIGLRDPLNQTGQAIANEIQQAPQQTDAQVAASFSSLASRFQAQVGQLESLQPPANLQGDWNSVIAAAQRLVSDLKAIAVAATTHNTSAAQEAGASLAADAQELTSALQPIKAALGLP